MLESKPRSKTHFQNDPSRFSFKNGVDLMKNMNIEINKKEKKIDKFKYLLMQISRNTSTN